MRVALLCGLSGMFARDPASSVGAKWMVTGQKNTHLLRWVGGTYSVVGGTTLSGLCVVRILASSRVTHAPLHPS
jgi:hypothetical protein